MIFMQRLEFVQWKHEHNMHFEAGILVSTFAYLHWHIQIYKPHLSLPWQNRFQLRRSNMDFQSGNFNDVEIGQGTLALGHWLTANWRYRWQDPGSRSISTWHIQDFIQYVCHMCLWPCAVSVKLQVIGFFTWSEGSRDQTMSETG